MKENENENEKTNRDGKLNKFGIVRDTRLKKLPSNMSPSNQKPVRIICWATTVSLNNIVGSDLRGPCVYA